MNIIRLSLLTALLFSVTLPVSAVRLHFETQTALAEPSDPYLAFEHRQTLLQQAKMALDEKSDLVPEIKLHYLHHFELEGLILRSAQLSTRILSENPEHPRRVESKLELETQRMVRYFENADTDQPLLESYAWLQAQLSAMASNHQPQQLNQLQQLEQGLRAWDRHDWKAAEQHFNRLISRAPQDPQYWLHRGRCRLMQKQLQAAAHDFATVIRLDPARAAGYFYRGYVSSLHQQPQAALEDFNLAITREGGNALYYNNRATVHNQLKQFRLALEDLNRAIDLRPQDASLWRNRAKTFEYLQNPSSALSNYDSAVALAPRQINHLLERGQLKVSQQDLKGALADFTKALFLDPNHSEALYLRGQVYTLLGVRHLAVSDYTRAIQISPDSPYFARRGSVYALNQDQQRRIQDFSILIQRHPRQIEPWFERGIAYLYSARPAQALKDFERGLQLAMGTPKIQAEHYFYRGLALRELKRCEGARRDFEKACQLGLAEACEHGCGKVEP
jgi:tetratricopeptide (TPR) repeat protein